MPGITDSVIWTPYTLSKTDQDWFYSLPTSLTLHLWSEEELDTYLSGEGLILRNTYFGELIITPAQLDRRHQESIQPIRERWLEPVHQTVDAERIIRRMLGEPSSWGQSLFVGKRLMKVVGVISESKVVMPELRRRSRRLLQHVLLLLTRLCTFTESLPMGILTLSNRSSLNEKRLSTHKFALH